MRCNCKVIIGTSQQRYLVSLGAVLSSGIRTTGVGYVLDIVKEVLSVSAPGLLGLCEQQRTERMRLRKFNWRKIRRLTGSNGLQGPAHQLAVFH
jgi:hypothetical protein